MFTIGPFHPSWLRSVMMDEFGDCVSVFLDGRCLRIVFPDADFSVRMRPLDPETGELIFFRATFREFSPDGGTWWQTWEKSLPANPEKALPQLLVSEIASRRNSFRRLLRDHRERRDNARH